MGKEEIFTRQEGDYLMRLIYKDVTGSTLFSGEKSFRMKLRDKINDKTEWIVD